MARAICRRSPAKLAGVIAVRMRALARTSTRLEEEEPQTGGADHGLRPALRPQFAQDGVDVELDGMLADVQAVSDGFIGETFSQEL